MSQFWIYKTKNLEYLVEYQVKGQHLPATWGYWGGEPEEVPELEIIEITPMFDVEATLSDEDCPYVKEDLVGSLVDKEIYAKLRQELKL